MSDETNDPMEALIGIVAVVTLPLTALAGIFLGETAAAVVAITGWLFLVPVLAILSEYVDLSEWWDSARSGAESVRDREPDRAETGDDALQRLRERYADGEIDDVEFERRLERLVQTEDLEVPDGVTSDGPATDGDPRQTRDRERTPEREPE